ncbi:hypothetical protein ACCC92_05495 [Mucilaginibacter sp. Mucisp84]|uniref:hypothetical protein n=1 Tax=Mucilaginibacter sp. Mucisp84 TaxID=3243058 RepID=UPI0039A41B96
MRIAILSIFILLQSVNPLSKPNSLFKYQHLHVVDMSKYAVLPVNQQFIDSWFGKEYRTTQLADADFVEIDNILIRAVEDHNKRKEYGAIYNPYKYYKQVLAMINGKGEKEVYLNCLCAIHYPTNWKKHLVNVMDGGNCYFQVRINLKTKQVISFSVNGIA